MVAAFSYDRNEEGTVGKVWYNSDNNKWEWWNTDGYHT